MQWSDEGIVLATRRHGENNVILEAMTPHHGRHLGLVRGGRSRQHQPTLQPGNGVVLTWRARLDEHLGTYAIEPTIHRAARLMVSPLGIHVIQLLAAHFRLLPERDPHERLYGMLAALLDHIEDEELVGELLVRFELALLEDLGFGLDLSTCAATGGTADLRYVSPKSGRAVSGAAGLPYRDRLLGLPAFLSADPGSGRPGRDEIGAGFGLAEFFFARHVYEPRGIAAPAVREWLVRHYAVG